MNPTALEFQLWNTLQPIENTDAPLALTMLPQFNPDLSDSDYHAWFAAVDARMVNRPLVGEDLINALKKSLKGSATSWVSELTQPDLTWNHFKDLFLIRYYYSESEAASLTNINNERPEDGVFVTPYAKRLMMSREAIWRNVKSEEIVWSYVIAHFAQYDEEFKMPSMYLKRTRGVDDSEESLSKRYKSSVPDPLPPICNDLPHGMTEYCKSRKLNDARSTIIPSTSEAALSSGVGNTACFQCGENGHIAMNCPSSNFQSRSNGNNDLPTTSQSFEREILRQSRVKYLKDKDLKEIPQGTESSRNLRIKESRKELPLAPLTSEESETEGHLSSDTSPQRQKRSGILKGGRLWRSLDRENSDQNDDQRSTTTSDDDGSITTTRTVRFVDKLKDANDDDPNDSESSGSDTESATESQKEDDTSTAHRMETPLILVGNASKTNSAVQQLFNSSRPPPPAIEPQLITSETLRAWDAGVKPKTEDAAVKRVAERNALRCSLLRNEARKKQQPKQETTSLAERIRLLTCDVEDDEQTEEQRCSPAGASVDKFSTSSDKSYTSIDKNNEKAFGSASSSSSSSTISAPVPTRQQPPDLGDMHQETQKPKPEPRRQFLSTLAPLTACVGIDSSAAHHEGFYYVPPGDRTSASAATTMDFQEHNDSPAPDVVAGTPGAAENDASLAAFARASASRTERIRQRYGQESQPVSSDDEHDDYGFHRRPAVRGIAVKQQLGASDDILQQMQNELLPTPSSTSAPVPAHSCQRTSSHYSWPYYSEANLNSRPQSRSSVNTNWSKNEYASGRQCSTAQVQQPHAESCFAHAQSMGQYAHYQHRQQDAYRNCSLYANMGCSDSSQELYSSQTSSEPTSPVRNRRPESPPPIRSHHQLLYVPYSNHYHYQQDYAQNWSGNDYSHMQSQYQQQAISGASTPQPAVQPQRAHYTHALQVQTLCPAPARYRPVPAPQLGGGKQMICYSEKVAAPLYQPAPGSPSRNTRGAPEGAPSNISAPAATSPMAAPPNPVYYAMNV